jgi:hypothetical protein
MVGILARMFSRHIWTYQEGEGIPSSTYIWTYQASVGKEGQWLSIPICLGQVQGSLGMVGTQGVQVLLA